MKPRGKRIDFFDICTLSNDVSWLVSCWLRPTLLFCFLFNLNDVARVCSTLAGLLLTKVDLSGFCPLVTESARGIDWCRRLSKHDLSSLHSFK